MVEKLERSLSLFGGVAVIVGLVVGGSIFVLIPSLAAMCGPGLWLAYLLSGIPAVFGALYLMQLGAALPVTGANYVAVTRWISPMAGFSMAIAGLVAIISTNCLVSWGFAQYLTSVVPSLPTVWIAILILLLFALINWIGVRVFEWIQIVMMIIFMVAMLIFGIAGTLNANPEYTAPLFPKGISNFFMVIAIATFSWSGLVAITEVAGEVKNPKRNIPLALILSVIIILILYVLQTYALTANIHWEEAGKIGSTAIIQAAKNFMPGWAVTYIVIAALLAMATTVNSIMLLAAREILAASRDLVLPKFLSRLGRFNTPDFALLGVTIISIIGILAAASLDKYALMVVFALMVIKILGATAVWRMPRVAPDIYAKSVIRFSPFLRGFIWIGCLVLFIGIFAFGLLADFKTGLVFVAIYVVAVVYWYIRKSYMKSRGVDLDGRIRSMSESVLAELEGQ